MTARSRTSGRKRGSPAERNSGKPSNERSGCQGLRHDSYHNPQYAIIANAMDHIVTGGNNFISAKRSPPAEAQPTVRLIVA